MPRMSKKRKQEWALFLNERNRITYNGLCKKCSSECKQSFRCVVVHCPKYLSKRRTKNYENDWKWNECNCTSWNYQGNSNVTKWDEIFKDSIPFLLQNKLWKISRRMAAKSFIYFIIESNRWMNRIWQVHNM